MVKAMRRYRRAPVAIKRTRADGDGDDAWWEDRNEMGLSLTVYEPETQWEATGLLDADGQPIQAYVGMDPIGFVHFEDEE